MADEKVTHEEMLAAWARFLEKRGDDWRKYDPIQGDNIQQDFRTAAKYLRASLTQLEARRWRDRVDAPDTDDPILGYSPIAGNPAEDEECGHYAITSGSFLQSGGWENCTLWKPISPPSATSEGE